MRSYYRVTKLDERRLRIYDPLGVHMDLFIGREKALLLDTGFGFADLAGIVRELTDTGETKRIAPGMEHADHGRGNQYVFFVRHIGNRISLCPG